MIHGYGKEAKPKVEVVVPPGQKHRREGTWDNLHADIAAGNYRGIILVSAYGYHSVTELGSTSIRSFKRNKSGFLKAYLKGNRIDEIAVLRQLQPHLRVNPKKLWFVSLIAKQDLWWPNHTQAEEHYRSGEYGTEIRRMLEQKHGAIRHEFAFASLLIANLIAKNNEVLKPNSQGYDYRLQAQSLRRLFETVDALKQWESEK
jgi:hypothetical protein